MNSDFLSSFWNFWCCFSALERKFLLAFL